MINVSNDFKKQLANDNRNYLEYADITLKDGTVLHLTNENLWNGGLSVEDAVSSDNSFDIGAAIINKGTLTINNIYDDFSDYVFEDAEVIAFVGLELPDGTIEKIRKGTYAVDEPSYNGSIITLSCLDNMRKFDRVYSESKLAYPATLNAIVRDACSVCGVTLNTVSFPHDDFVVQTCPADEAVTFREVISWVAQIAGCFCRCDVYGRLELKWYDQTVLENPKVIDWGAENPTGTENAHWLKSNYSAPVVSLDDVVITGVRVVEKNESEETQEQLTTYQSGTDGYVISIENNELIKGGAGQTVAGWLGEQLIGVKFRKATVNHASDPTIEAGDIAMVTDRKGNNYNIVVSSTKFSTGSSQNTVSAAENPARNSAARYSAATKNYVEWRKAIEKEKTEREKALEELGERLENSSGVFTTVETQPDGSKVYYLHNKPNLSESDMVWKMTAEAWGVSTDGGKTWNAGMTVDGDTIVRILTATGVNADWINTGAITVKDNSGNVIFSVDMDTKQVIISGDSVRIGGKPATTALNDVLAESKDYADGKLADYANTVTANITNLQSQIDGAIETFFYDYEPTLQNIPASQWTTTEERRKHEGDLFYWKSKGYAYRFFQDGATWKWQLVQDTDITQAMAAAEKAQDTADGKRRVFVVTPQPPYDIGDLWTNGADILTCAVARAEESAYVSSDWQKLNKYTDDTVANEALEEARKSRNLNIILDNEYQGIPADYQGNIASFPTVKTFVQVLYGHTDVSVDCSYGVAKSAGVTGTWDGTTRTYTVTALTADTGWVDITASYLSLFTTTKRFNIAKVKGGIPGEQGTQGINLFRYTKDMKIGEYVGGSSTNKYEIDAEGFTVATIKADGNWRHIDFYFTDIPISEIEGKRVTISAWVKSDALKTSPELFSFCAAVFDDKNRRIRYQSLGAFDIQRYNVSDYENGEWVKLVYKGPGLPYVSSMTVDSETIEYVKYGIMLYVSNANTQYPLQVKKVKCEFGTVDNPVWTPAIEDLQGPQGIPGEKGKDGKTYYTWLKYADTPTSGMSDNPDGKKYIGLAYNKESSTESNNYSDYTWSLIKGTDGVPGKNGADGKTYYTWIKYATSASGENMSDDPTGKTYIGLAYNKTTATESNTASDYAWSLIKGDKGDKGATGTAARTYFIEPSTLVLKRSADNSISPNFVEFKAFYRDGNNTTRTAYAGRFLIEESSDGKTWKTIYTSSADETSISHSVYSALATASGAAISTAGGNTIGVARDIIMLRCTLYASGGTSNALDIQSVTVVTDVEALTHEEIFNLLTNNGEVKGIYKEGNQLYISFTYARGGELVLGGVNNENGIAKIYNADGSYVQMDGDGITHYNEGEKKFYHYLNQTGNVTITTFNSVSYEGTATVQLPNEFKGKDITVTPYIQGVVLPTMSWSGYLTAVSNISVDATVDKGTGVITITVKCKAMYVGGTSGSSVYPSGYMAPESVTVAYTAIA